MLHFTVEWAGYKGSHAIALWGYDDNTRTFVFRNSWGTNWGTKGYGHMPYEYVYKYATELVAVERLNKFYRQ